MTDFEYQDKYCMIFPSEKFSKKKVLKNVFQKIKAPFLRKENIPKLKDLERILLPLKGVLGRSEVERLRTYSSGFETISFYFGTFSLLSNKLHLWTHS